MPRHYTDDDWRSSIINLPEAQRLMAARFLAPMAGHLAEPAWKMLLKRLRTESPEFREVWDRHEVIEQRGRRKEFVNRHVGHVSVAHTDLWLGPEAGSRMVVYAPADEETRRRLEKLRAIALERVSRVPA